MDPQQTMQYLHEVFGASLPRLAPGDGTSTIKALNMLIADGHPFKTHATGMDRRILDIGCGNGGQTVNLTKHLEGFRISTVTFFI